MLSELLNVHMEDFLVKKIARPILCDMEQLDAQVMQKRCLLYYNRILQSVA